MLKILIDTTNVSYIGGVPKITRCATFSKGKAAHEINQLSFGSISSTKSLLEKSITSSIHFPESCFESFSW